MFPSVRHFVQYAPFVAITRGVGEGTAVTNPTPYKRSVKWYRGGGLYSRPFKYLVQNLWPTLMEQRRIPKNRIPLNPLYPRISSYPVSLNRLTLHIRLLLFVFVSILSPSDLRKVIVPLLSFVHFHVGELLKKSLKIILFCFSCFIFASYQCCFRRQTIDTLFVHQPWFFSPRFLAR